MGKIRDGTWTGRRVNRGVSMSPELARRVDETVARLGISRSSWLRTLIARELMLLERGRPVTTTT